MIRAVTLLFIACAFLSSTVAATPAPASSAAQDPLQVVATLPDLADLISAIGGDLVEVKTLARPGQNLHAVRVKPSHLVAVSRADLFVQVGLSLEHAWVPGLLRTSRNRDVLPGMDGFVSAGEGYAMIEVPERLDRAVSADVHPQGNPHVNLSLGGGLHMAKAILAGLIRVDPANTKRYEAGFAAWKLDYDKSLVRWKRIAAATAKLKSSACLYHQEFDYLLGEMGFTLGAFLEPRPGLAPTPAHLAKVIRVIDRESIPVVLTAPWSNNKNVARVSKTTGAAVLELPVMAGGAKGHETWIGMMDDCVVKLAEAYGVDVEVAAKTPLPKVPVEAGANADSKGENGAGKKAK